MPRRYITYLYSLHLIGTRKDGIEEGNSVNEHLHSINDNTIANVIWMLDEKENTGTQELLCGDGKDER